MELYFGIVIVLFALAVSGLIVGVSNDAVNFLNSAIGSRVASRRTIMIVASLGIMLGVLFSGGMMEVARKGIFHPGKFVMPELLVIFLAVMLTNVILLDLYNTFGLPTSSTVSIVFSLLGGAVAVSLIKIHNSGQTASELFNYINTAKAITIILGILMSVAIAFTAGLIVQFLTRLLFTFDFAPRLKWFGSIWAGIALTSITYFILVKGAKHASFLSHENYEWIKTHTGLIILFSLIIWTIIFQLLMWFTRINILKIIILVGTGALALAFAANDLVNFIGVPLAGFSSFNLAKTLTEPFTTNMGAMSGKVQTDTWLLLLAGAIMAITLWFSKKARTVTKTELTLGGHDENEIQFGASPFSRVVVRMAINFFNGIKVVIPGVLQQKIALRFKASDAKKSNTDEKAHWDLLRASVNLMVASVVISFATSLKLPLSTTYVTFMVTMGTSLADGAWGRESAVYRVTGVLTVIGGWFFTAIMASMLAMILAFIIYYFKTPAIVALVGLSIFLIIRTHHLHKEREGEADADNVAQAPTNVLEAVVYLFERLAAMLKKSKNNIDHSFEGVFRLKRDELKAALKGAKSIKKSANKSTSYAFKILSEYSNDDFELSPKVVGALREIPRHLSFLAEICFEHVENNHKELLQEQVIELSELKANLGQMLDLSIDGILTREKEINKKAIQSGADVIDQIRKCKKAQLKRVKKGTTGMRQSVLYLNILSHSEDLTMQTIHLVEGCQETTVIK